MIDNSSRKARPGLGRGLSALLGDSLPEEPTTGTEERSGVATGLRQLPIGAMTPHPDQPRRHFDEAALSDLAESIGTRGLIQPIVVRPHGKGYQIVAGERRWRAAQRARLHEIPVIVRELTDAEALEIALVENIQRQDLNAIEEAEAYSRLIEQFGHTQEALGRLVNKSRSHVANLLRLLELPDPVRAAVIDGSLSMGHARALIGAPDAEALARRVIDQGLSVRQTEKLARDRKPAANRSKAAPVSDTVSGASDADIAALERQLSDVLGLGVNISFGEKGGTLTVSYSTLDQLDLVCQRLSGEII